MSTPGWYPATFTSRTRYARAAAWTSNSTSAGTRFAGAKLKKLQVQAYCNIVVKHTYWLCDKQFKVWFLRIYKKKGKDDDDDDIDFDEDDVDVDDTDGPGIIQDDITDGDELLPNLDNKDDQ